MPPNKKNYGTRLLIKELFKQKTHKTDIKDNLIGIPFITENVLTVIIKFFQRLIKQPNFFRNL